MKKSAGAFIIHDKKLLMLERDDNPAISNPNCWQLIGGDCEENEEFIDTLIREIREETGVEIQKESAQEIGKVIVPGKQEYFIYLVKFSEDQAKSIKLGNEGQDLKFVSIGEMESLKFGAGFSKYFRQHKEGLEKLIGQEILDKKGLGFNNEDICYLKIK